MLRHALLSADGRQAVDGARYILEGSVRSSAKMIRVTAHLIDGKNQLGIWAEQIDREGCDAAFNPQDDVARSIIASVQTQIILSEDRPNAADGSADRAPRLLARAWLRFMGLTEESLADCLRLAERALECDPRSGKAHRLRAVALYHPTYMGFVPWTKNTIDALHKHAKIAIESDEADEYCHWAMECAQLLRSEHELAAASLRRAREINPNCSLAIGSMGTVLAWSGHYDASVQSNELALRLDPQDPSNFFRHFGLALAHYLAGRYEKAVAHARMAVQSRPGWGLAKMIYAASLAQSTRPNEAANVLSDFPLAGGKKGMAFLGVLPFAKKSDRDHLEEGLREARAAIG